MIQTPPSNLLVPQDPGHASKWRTGPSHSLSFSSSFSSRSIYSWSISFYSLFHHRMREMLTHPIIPWFGWPGDTEMGVGILEQGKKPLPSKSSRDPAGGTSRLLRGEWEGRELGVFRGGPVLHPTSPADLPRGAPRLLVVSLLFPGCFPCLCSSLLWLETPEFVPRKSFFMASWCSPVRVLPLSKSLS